MKNTHHAIQGEQTFFNQVRNSPFVKKRFYFIKSKRFQVS